jgi:NADH:ubiquinone oxidoreductase subunit 4 (subunit M)
VSLIARIAYYFRAKIISSRKMLSTSLLLIPLLGIIAVSSLNSFVNNSALYIKITGLATSVATLLVSLLIFLFFDSSTNQFQFVQQHYNVQIFDIYLGLDGISIYFVLLTTIIMPIALLSN